MAQLLGGDADEEPDREEQDQAMEEELHHNTPEDHEAEEPDREARHHAMEERLHHNTPEDQDGREDLVARA